MVKIKIKKLRDDAIIPKYAHDGDAGMDLYSCVDRSLEQGQRMVISTGIGLDFPNGYVALIMGRSGLAIKNGIAVLGGVVDCTYRGDVGVVLLNNGYDDVVIKKGDRIAQLLIQPVVNAEIQEVESLSESIRGNNGFGSSGK